MHIVPPVLGSRVGALLGREVLDAEPVAGGYTQAGRWRVLLEDGQHAFVKIATDAETAGWIRSEWSIYTSVHAPWLARPLGWEDGPRPLLVLEDLSYARWPPPWESGDVERVVETLGAVARTPPPPGLGRLADARAQLYGWSAVTRDPEPFLGLGIVDEPWLDRHLPTLVAIEHEVPLAGGALLHLDVRSDNLCFDGRRVVLVDWNHALVGNPAVDLAFWLPSLWSEGGPPPWKLLPEAGQLAALVTGFFAARAGLPPVAVAPRVRNVQRAQLEAALPWMLHALEIEPPHGKKGR